MNAMDQSLSTFEENVGSAKNLMHLHDFIVCHVKAPFNCDDLLRAQVVYVVSAFDKLIHDLIRVGMQQIYTGARLPTQKYLSESISLEIHATLVTATIPPKEHLFEQEVARKLATLSFQRSDKISEGLSLIWCENHKWAKISSEMGMKESDVRTKFNLVATRRNAIVHESDISPVSNEKNILTRPECEGITDFMCCCGKAIARLVRALWQICLS